MQLSLDYLAKLGYACQIVERRLPIPGKFVTQDCFGFADILAYRTIKSWKEGPMMHQYGGIILIQTTSWANFGARKRKIFESPHRLGWINSGGRIWLHGWGAKGLREEEL